MLTLQPHTFCDQSYLIWLPVLPATGLPKWAVLTDETPQARTQPSWPDTRGGFDRAQRRRSAAQNRAARHANRENGQPARTNQAPADDANREDGQPARLLHGRLPKQAAAQAIAALVADAQAAQAAAQAEAQIAAGQTIAAQTAVAQAAAQAAAAQTAAAQVRPFPVRHNRLPLHNIGTQRLGQC
ncbi:TPA: hypothetical protein ACH3X2_011482 [Trebouxia sp. C0005]